MGVKNRDRWSSRTTFILGALGSAVGLGNLWRFPFLVFSFGGGSFLIPYVICMLGIGVPILFLEVAMGRKFQGGDPVCFSALHPRLLGIGWMSLFGTLLLAVYYPVLIAWIVIFFFNSFQDPLPWALRTNETGLSQLQSSFFTEDVLDDSGSISEQNSFNWGLIFSLAFVWVCIYFSIFKGVKVVSKVVIVSVPVPILTLVVLLFTSIGREGSQDGITQYVGTWNTTALESADIWQAAVGQVFFSIGVCFGIMTAYSSYMEEQKGLLSDALLIALLDAAVSFFAGFVVFMTIGALAHDIQVPFSDEDFINTISGASLVFIAYPAGLSNIGDVPGPQIFSIVFFLTLFFLAIDSAFSLVEAIVTGIRDTNAFSHYRSEYISFLVCLFLFIFGIFFALDNGSYFLDIIDAYLNGYIMLGVGTLECLAATWVFGLKESREEFGDKSMIAFSGIYIVGMILTPIFMIALDDNAILAGFMWWLACSVAAIVIGLVLAKPESKVLTRNGALRFFFSGGATKLVSFIAVDECGSYEAASTWYKGVLYSWVFLLKYLIPVFLYMMMITGASTRYADEEKFDTVFENIGKFVTVVAWSIFFLFVLVKVEAYSEKINHEFETRNIEEKVNGDNNTKQIVET